MLVNQYGFYILHGGNMALSFFDRLYDGFRAEYFVMGELFGAGYEGFKLPADFGFDVLATNQKESSLGAPPVGRIIAPPYALQVKSRNITRTSFGDGPSGRPQAFLDFWITEKDFDLISAEQGGYLVCVISVAGADGEISGRNLLFWLHSSHLALLKERGYFVSQTPPFQHNQPYLRLKVCIRLLPTLDAKQLIDKLVEEGNVTAAGKQRLNQSLPDKLAVTWRGTEYLSLVRTARNDPNDEVVRQIPSELTSFSNLGMATNVSMPD